MRAFQARFQAGQLKKQHRVLRVLQKEVLNVFNLNLGIFNLGIQKGNAGIHHLQGTFNLLDLKVHLCQFCTYLRQLQGDGLGVICQRLELLRHLLHGCGNLGDCLGFSVVQGFLGIFQRNLALQQLNPAHLQLQLPVFEGFLVVGNLLFAVFQLPIGIPQLVVGFVNTVIICLCAVLIFFPAVLVAILRLLADFLEAFLSQRLNFRFQLLGSCIHGVIIGFGINLIVPGQGHVNFRIVVCIHSFFRDKHDVVDGTAAYGGAAEIHVHVQRRAYKAHHGEGLLREAFQAVFIIGIGNDNLRSDIRRGSVEAIKKALSGIFRPAAFQQDQFINGFGNGIEPENGVFPIGAPHNIIRVEYPLHLGKAGNLAHFFHLLPSPAIGAGQTQVKEILRVGISLTSGHHVRFGHFEAHKNTGTQSNDHGNGDVPSQGLFYGTGQIRPHCISLFHHSISEISIGCSFFSTDTTVPLRTRMTRSAMAVSAPLWVMIMMVMPVRRPVS